MSAAVRLRRADYYSSWPPAQLEPFRFLPAVKFDGGQATDGGKLSICVDGTPLQLKSPSGTVLPSKLVNAAAGSDQLMLGNAFNAFTVDRGVTTSLRQPCTGASTRIAARDTT
jgi:hypothetical protein